MSEEEAKKMADEAVLAFARAVLHGNAQHRKWLMEAAEAFIKGIPLPEPY